MNGKKNSENKKIGFIGQGWIGKNYADNFEQRGFDIIRYSLEEPYNGNKEKIGECDIVFIAVPTPTTPEGFDVSYVEEALGAVGKGKIAVIKSTILPGTTVSLQKNNPSIYVMHSPEFLTRHTVVHDVAFPDRNIIGIPYDNEEYRRQAEEVMKIFPAALYNIICKAEEAEIVKYGSNCFFYFKNIFMNMIYDLAGRLECDWEKVREAIVADPRVGEIHTHPVNKGGRGVGGECLIKDFEAFSSLYEKLVGDDSGLKVLRSLRDKNIDLLVSTNKDIDLLAGVYGKEILKR